MSASRSLPICLTGGFRWYTKERPISGDCPPTATTSLRNIPSPVHTRFASGYEPEGFALTERWCVYPQYIGQEWLAQGVLEHHQARVLVVSTAQGIGPQARRDDPR